MNILFFKPDKPTKQTIDLITFDPRLITENNLIDDNKPYRYEQNIQEQQSLFTTNENYNENDNNNEDYTPENQNENRNGNIVQHIIEKNTNEYTTPESTTSTQDTSQTGPSTNNQINRVPTRIVSPRPNTYNPRLDSDTSPRRIITFNFPSNSDDEIKDETQNITSLRNTSVNVSSPTRTILDNTQNITRSIYDPPSLPSTFKYPNKTIRSENNNNQQTSSRYYDPFNFSFYLHSNTSIQMNNNQDTSQPNKNPNLLAHHSYTYRLSTNSRQTNSLSQNQRIPYSNIVQSSHRRSQNPPLSCISTDLLYQMNTTYNPTQSSSTVNMAQSIAPPPHYISIQQDTFINTSASIPEPMKPFDGLDHSYTPEEYLQQVEARLTFAIGEEPQNNPVKYRSWHNRRMAYIQCSLIGTALDWYNSLHISYKQQWNSFVQLFKKQFSSQKTAYYAQVEAMSLMKKDNETVRHFAVRVQQLVTKGWCNENAATINFKNIEIFTEGFPKKFEDFAHKRQVKHVSTLLEPSIPFHTLVRHVDPEDIANEKVRTHDLALEINKISIDNDNNDEELQHDHIMVTQSGDPNNKSKPAYKKYCSYCHKNNHGVSICYQKQRDEELPNNLLYNTSVVMAAIPKKTELKIKLVILLEIMTVIDIVKTTVTIMIDIEIMIDTEVAAENFHKTTIDLILDRDITIDPEVHTHLDLDMTTIIKEELHLDLHTDHHTETTLITDIILYQCSQSQGNSFKRYNYPYRSPYKPRDYRHDPEHLNRTDNKTELIK